MPELPEVETVSRQLHPLVRGQRVTAVEVIDSRCTEQDLQQLLGWRVERGTRLGKQVALVLIRGSKRLWLAVHLRMSGRLLWQAGAGQRARDHLRAIIELEQGALLFVDTRRFGTIRFDADPARLTPGGLDPMSEMFTAARLGKLLEESRQALKVWLLRQDRLVGLGNIYACEILHRARLSPTAVAGDLDRLETARLWRATRWVLQKAVDNCGTTFSDFQDASGSVGGYQRYLKVYGREGEPCRRCGAAVVRQVLQQRSTFYCPACQQDFGARQQSAQGEQS